MSDAWPPSDALRALWRDRADAETFFDALFGAILETLQAERVIVFLAHPSGACSPWRGRDRDDRLSDEDLEDASRSLVERCAAEAQVVTWEKHAGGAVPASAAALDLHAAVAAPVGAPVRAVLYVDFRRLTGMRNLRRPEVFREAASLVAEALAPHEFKVSPAAAAIAPPRPDLDALLTLPGLYAMAPAIGVALANPAPVLVLGETGSGKTLLAGALARKLSPRGREPVRAMLGTSDDFNTIASELFGHAKGAFTGADARRDGLVKQAHGGVLILDELLNLPLAAQQLLLDFAQFGEYRPLGHKEAAPERAEVRLIAVTNGDLEAAVRERRFRADLYHRLAGTVLTVPPLRERRGDLPGLAAILLGQIDPSTRWRLSYGARRALRAERIAWEGNVRQFELVLRRAVERARREPSEVPEEVAESHLDPELLAPPSPSRPPTALPPTTMPPTALDAAGRDGIPARVQSLRARKAALAQEEEALIAEALAACGGSKREAAALLDMEYTTLTSRLAKRRGA